MRKIIDVFLGKSGHGAPLLLLALILGIAEGASASVPTFTIAFSPSTIGPGSISRLTYTIDNSASETGVSDLDFTHSLPANMEIAAFSDEENDCTDAVLDLDEGGGSITLTGGRLGSAAVCTVALNVTGTAAGSHLNTTGDLTSSAGNSGPASATLTVDASRPGFTMAFSPNPVAPGQIVTLTYTLDNSLNGSNATAQIMTHSLPVGLEVASVPNTDTDCVPGPLSPVITAAPGDDTVSFLYFGVNAGTTCTASVDLLASNVGVVGTTTGDLSTNNSNPSGPAGAELSVVREFITKTFTDDPVVPGDTVTLEYTLTNLDRGNTASDIAFTDDLEATLTGLVATGLPQANVCNGGTLSGTDEISLSGASLAPEASCTFSVTLQVPAGANAGSYPGETGVPTADLGSGPENKPKATDTLVVQKVPVLTLTVDPDAATPGTDVSFDFELVNTDAGNTASAIGFIMPLNHEFDVAVETLPAANSCGAGSTFTETVDSSANRFFKVQNAELAGGDSCNFSLILTVPSDTPSGTYNFETDPLTATVNTVNMNGGTAADTLAVVSPPVLTQAFASESVVPGNSIDLEFTLTLNNNSPADATNISFTEDFHAVMPGMKVSAVPNNGFCGASAEVDGLNTGAVSVSGAELAPGTDCSFTITLDVPDDAAPGTHTVVSSTVSAEVNGLSPEGSTASDTLTISGLSISKSFLNAPLAPGAAGTLRYTIENDAGALDATDIQFSDNLNLTLSTLQATGLPATPCGAGSTITGTTNLSFSGGSLGPGDSCTFDVSILVPAGAAEADYVSVTSGLSATVNLNNTESEAASTILTVETPLSVDETFADDPVFPGDTVTLRFTLENLHPTETMTKIKFTSDLETALTGLAATGLPQSDVCGTGSEISGTGVLSFTEGTLAPGADCTFDITLQVPGASNTDTYPANITGIGGDQGATPFTRPDVIPADTLIVALAPTPGQMVLTQTLTGSPVFGGGKLQADYLIENTDAVQTADNVSFTIDLDAILPGLTASTLPPADMCGDNSSVTGTGELSFQAREMGPDSDCSFTVILSVPDGATEDDYTLATEALVAAFGANTFSYPADSDPFTVESPLTVTKRFTDDPINPGDTVTMEITVTNTHSTETVTDIAFTDDLDGLISGLAAQGLPQDDVVGSGSTLTGTGTLALSGGTLGAGESETISVTLLVPGDAPSGAHASTTGDITGSRGSGSLAASFSVSGASDTLNVNALPSPLLSVTKAFTDDPVYPGDTVTLSFTLRNDHPTQALTGISFSDDLDSALSGLVAEGLPKTDICGTGSDISGTASLAFSGGTLAAGDSCSFSVTLQVPGDGASGNHASTTGTVSHTLSGTSLTESGVSDTLAVTALPSPLLTFTKAFTGDPVIAGEEVTLTFTIENGHPTQEVTGLSFTDSLDAAVSGMVAVDLPKSDICGTGSDIAGTSSLAFSGGTLPAGANCSFDVTLALPGDAASGNHTNTTSALSYTMGGASLTEGGVNDILVVDPLPQDIIRLDKVFVDDPVLPGTRVELEYTIENTHPARDLTGISFSDNLDAALTDLVAINTPMSDVCGTGSTLSGTGTLSFSGGSLAVGDSCTFTVLLKVPRGLDLSDHTSATGSVTGTMGGAGITSNGASDVLSVDPTVPTLSEWGMIVLSILLCLGAVRRIRREDPMGGRF